MQKQDAIEKEKEQAARLHGLIAVLGLPPARHADGTWKRVPVEVEIAPDLWEPVDGLTIEAERFVFRFGPTVEWVFKRVEGVPRWRTPREEKIVVAFGAVG